MPGVRSSNPQRANKPTTLIICIFAYLRPPRSAPPHATQRATKGTPGVATFSQGGSRAEQRCRPTSRIDSMPQRRERVNGFLMQSLAVLQKNLALQRRTFIGFVFVACLPLLLVGLLLIIQHMIDAELDSRDYRCGCRCTSCCDFVPRSSLADDGSLGPGAGGGLGLGRDGARNNDDFKKVCYDATPDRPCSPNAECLAYDDTTCGPQYSTYEQIPFCGVPRPPTWPALVQFPLAKYRPRMAEPTSPQQQQATASAARSEPSNLLASPEPSSSGDVGTGGGGGVEAEGAVEGGDGGALQFSDSGPPAILPYTGQDPQMAAALTAALLPKDAGVLGRRLLSAILSSPQFRSGGLGRIAGTGGGLGDLDICEIADDSEASLAIAIAGGDSNGSSRSTGTGGALGGFGALGDLLGDQGTGDAALDEALSVLAEGDSDRANATEQSNALAVITQRIARLFADFDITLGTPADVSISMLLEPAFVKGTPVMGHGGGGGGGGGSMGGGASFGGGNDNFEMVSEAMPLYLISPNCTALTSGELDGTLLHQLSCGLRLALGGVPLVCATLQPEWRSSLAEINRELYCGWADAECGAASAPSRGDESTPGSTMKGVAGDSQSTDTASFGSREGGGTAGSRRALKSFGSHPSLGMPGEVGDAQAGVQFGGSSKEESRVLAKVREGSRTLAMDSSALFQQQSFFLPAWQTTTPVSSSAELGSRPLTKPAQADGNRSVSMLPNRTEGVQQEGKPAVLQMDAADFGGTTGHLGLSLSNGALSSSGDGSRTARALLQSSTDRDSSPSGSSGQGSPRHKITQYPSLVIDWGATRTKAASGTPPPGGSVVGDPSAPAFDLTLWLNSSQIQSSLAPPVQRWSAPINLATSAFIAQYFREASAGQASNTSSVLSAEPRPRSAGPTIKLEGLAAFPSNEQPLKVDIASLLGPLFFMWVMQILLPVYVFALASERAGGQLGLMFCQGVSHSAYFAGTYTWALGLYIIYMVVFAGFGAGSGIGLFLHTSPGLQIVMYLLWFHSMFGLASWMSVFYTDVITGTMAAVAALIFSGLVANLVVVQFVQSGPEWLAIVLEAIIPPFALFRALWEAGQYAFLANSTGGQGLSFSNINDRKNGIPMSFGLMAIHAVVAMSFAAWYSQVMGADAGGEGLTGPRKHPFFMLGAKLGPDDPRGGAWFTYQVTLIPTRTRNALNFLFTCIPQAVRWCMSSKDRTQENESASPTAVAADADMNGGAVPAKATNRKMGKDAHVSAASKAAAAAVHKDMVSDDVRAEVEMVEELWDLVVPPQPGQQTHSLAEMEQQQQHGSNSLTTTSPNQRGGGRSVLTESTVMPVLLLRGVRKEFQLPQPFKLPKAPDLHNTLGLCGKEGNKDDRQQECEQKQQQHNGASRLAAPANEHATQHDSPASQNSGVPRCVEGSGEEGSVARQVVGSHKQGLGAIGKVAAAPPASKPNVKIAVAGLWLSVRKAECFGLLGPNGAGKTTALRLMQGLLEPSAGRVAVCGKDLETEPQAASRLTGICPQHDALWPALSAEEHLQLYGRLRGLRGAELAAAVHDRLLELGLLGPVSQDKNNGVQSTPVDPAGADGCTATSPKTAAEVGTVAAAHEDGTVAGSGTAGGHAKSLGSRVRGWCSESLKWVMRETATAAGMGSDLNLPAYRPISTYSGGMRRRLSVACALVGKSGTDEGATPVPAVAFLDEPAAGLDPASRSALWQAIRSARTRGTAIVLTTHSMAEAEALGDRLGIFVSGQMRALGSTQQLAARYAGSLLLSITTPPDQSEAVAQVLGKMYPSASQVYSAGGAASWEIPRTAAPLSTIMASLRRLRAHKGPGALRILDWGLTSASLDHVFATIVAACAEAEARKDDGNSQQVRKPSCEGHEGLVVEESGEQEEDKQGSGAQKREDREGGVGADPQHKELGSNAAVALNVGPNNV